MSTPTSPPPPGPPPSGPPPGPPPSGPPPGVPAARPARSRLPFVVAAVVLALVVVVVVAVLALAGGQDAEDARSVQDVADLAVAAAEDLDVDAGVDLLCQAPPAAAREEIDRLIERGREVTGDDGPDVEYAISDVGNGATGTFRVTLTSDDTDEERSFLVQVSVDGDRSCIDLARTSQEG